jgi:hypothetical protein
VLDLSCAYLILATAAAIDCANALHASLCAVFSFSIVGSRWCFSLFSHHIPPQTTLKHICLVISDPPSSSSLTSPNLCSTVVGSLPTPLRQPLRFPVEIDRLSPQSRASTQQSVVLGLAQHSATCLLPYHRLTGTVSSIGLTQHSVICHNSQRSKALFSA